MPYVPGLRSPFALVGRLVYVGRMLDKIRLKARGELPADYLANYGDAKPIVFDSRLCRFLALSHAELEKRTLEGGSDEEVLAWAEERGAVRTDEECLIWNRFMTKIGWKDERTDVLRQRLQENGHENRGLNTFFEMIDADEGRDPIGQQAWNLKKADTLIVMGVSGSGKSTLGTALATSLGAPFLEGDDYHPQSNRAKMTSGTPLTDEDRLPWLASLKTALETPGPKVLSCSALKESYRRLLAPDLGRIRFIMTHTSREVLQRRLEGRKSHFMPATLLQSQLDTLETPAYALQVDAAAPVEESVARIRSVFRLP